MLLRRFDLPRAFQGFSLRAQGTERFQNKYG